MTSLHQLWQQQQQYNAKIIAEEGISSPSHWTQVYLLGLISEVDEILSDIQWKRHRKKKQTPVDRINLAYELADMTKYIMSLWGIWGFTADEMLQYVDTKTRMLELLYQQEFATIPVNRPVLICDIDGTMGDWRTSFIEWVKTTQSQTLAQDLGTSLLLDRDLDLKYTKYYPLKETFERKGGYQYIIPYTDTITTIQQLQMECDVYVIIVTARPVDVYHRIWLDTWDWLAKQNLQVDQLRICTDSRILLATSLQEHDVIMFEDNPNLILRAANSGIRVFVRRQPYNERIVHEQVTIVDKYTDLECSKFFDVSAEIRDIPYPA